MAPTPRPGIMDIAPYVPGSHSVPGVELRAVLSANENPLGASPRAVAAFKAHAEKLHRYPEGGSTALRAALARHYGLDAARIVCGNGSDELIGLLVHAYAGPGDEVLYSQYGFLMYPIAARANGAVPVTAPEKDFRADVDAILKRVTAKTRIVFLANPNNPTGTYLSREEVARLAEGLPKGTLFVIDAAYAEFVVRNDYSAGSELVDRYDNVVMTRTFSKIHGLAALRLGWAYCPAGVADVLNRIRGPFNVNAAAQAAGLAALEDVAFTDATRTHNDIWRDWLAGKLKAMGLTVTPSVGNFLLVRFAADKGRDANAADAYMARRGIIPRKVAGYGLPDCLRITVGTEAETRAVADALADFLAGKPA
ncbi:MAG: histidinol-phosphate transaminase [Alphaproteobacteria bacterium]|nr:histidinol-phosphate transaminase [Alphaproteobacteria bacterium]